MRYKLRTLLPSIRWLRFSLRTLFLLTLVIGASLGVSMKRLRDRKAAIVAVRSMGGTMGIDYAGPDWLRDVVGDDECFWEPIGVTLGPNARQIGQDEPRLDDGSLRRIEPILKSFHRLEALDIRKSGITDESADLIGSLAGLKQLRLSNTRITNQTIRHISRLSQLEYLDLYATPITDECIADLCQLANLASIDLRQTAISGDGVSRLRQELPQCKIRN